MMFPWISRGAHVAMLDMLRVQISELTAERRVLLDRLGVLGLGGPLFALAGEQEPGVEEDAEAVDAAASEIEQLLRLRRRPSQLAEALTRKAQRDQRKGPVGPRVSWVPAADAAPHDMKLALDQAEAAGKMA